MPSPGMMLSFFISVCWDASDEDSSSSKECREGDQQSLVIAAQYIY